MWWIVPALLSMAMRPRSNAPLPVQKYDCCRNCNRQDFLGNFGFCKECFEIVNILDEKWLK